MGRLWKKIVSKAEEIVLGKDDEVVTEAEKILRGKDKPGGGK